MGTPPSQSSSWLGPAGLAAYVRAVAEAKSAGRTPPGRYRVRWYDPDGKPKMKTFARKVDAEAERTRMESRLNDGSYRDPAAARVKFAEVAESWLAAQLHLKRSTRARYRGVLDVHVIPKWGTTQLDRIHFEDIAEWLADLLSGEATGGRKLSPPVGPQGVRRPQPRSRLRGQGSSSGGQPGCRRALAEGGAGRPRVPR